MSVVAGSEKLTIPEHIIVRGNKIPGVQKLLCNSWILASELLYAVETETGFYWAIGIKLLETKSILLSNKSTKAIDTEKGAIDY